MKRFDSSKFLLLLLFSFLFTGIVFACEKPYKLSHENGLYIVKINLNAAKIKPYVSESLETVDVVAQKNNALVAINSGFFDAKSKKTVSYVISNGKILANPKENENLINNEYLKPYLDKIFNRGELRLLNCNDKIFADVSLHDEPIPENCTLLSSTQAGPVILPKMDLEKEFFILKQEGKVIRDSVGLLRRTDRSLVAIKGNYLYFIITDENTPLNIYELKSKLEIYKFEKALGFDGGGSVSLFVKQKNGNFYQDREEKGASRAVKSMLLVY